MVRHASKDAADNFVTAEYAANVMNDQIERSTLHLDRSITSLTSAIENASSKTQRLTRWLVWLTLCIAAGTLAMGTLAGIEIYQIFSASNETNAIPAAAIE